MPEMNATLFEKLTRPVLERSPTIKAFAWAPVVGQEDRARFEQRQQSGCPGFVLSGTPATTDAMPVEEPPWLVPVQFIEPSIHNR
jgi:CHASE1-domain containing sensor protein